MSKTSIIIIVVAVLLVIIIGYMMYSSAKQRTLSQQQNFNTQAPSTQKVNVADLGNFVGGFITGLKTTKDQDVASGGYTQAKMEYMASGGKTGTA